MKYFMIALGILYTLLHLKEAIVTKSCKEALFSALYVALTTACAII